mmetsp:Transcript_27248/g.42591  ORF Transcript_27248/g.42591 Transcript_27248/m.42591 type:complete len:360 (-) Transcript_27248:1624-2703(-)
MRAVKKKEEEPVKIEAPVEQVAVRAAAPPPPREPEIVERDIPVFNEVPVPVETIVPRYENVHVDRLIVDEVEVPLDKLTIQEIPVQVEKFVYKEVKVPFEVQVEQIQMREVVKEVPVERVVVQEVEVPVDRIVVKEVPVPIERIVEKQIVKEVPVEKIVVKDIPVPIEKIVIKDVQVPVEKIVERVIEKPVEKVVYQDRIVYQDKIVYQDRLVEVPVERVIYKPPAREVAYAETQVLTGGMYASQWQMGVGGSRKIGLGIRLKKNQMGQAAVQEVLSNFGAEKSGQLFVEDVILSIEGQSVEGWDLDSIKQLTIGAEGTTCSLVVFRQGQQLALNILRILPSFLSDQRGYEAMNVLSTQ